MAYFGLERLVIRPLHSLMVAAFAIALGGCGGSGSGAPLAGTGSTCIPGDASTSAECGTVLVAVTDAEGDFVSYAIDILSITLQRANGGSVETLPGTTRVDFTELTDLSELLSAATLAPGDIVGGTIRLDYGTAEVFVESGGQIVEATVVDPNGQALGITELEIRLADTEQLVVTRGRTAFLTLDFDLAASHAVDTTQTPAVVTAEPYIVAEAVPIIEKELRVRGALIDVDLVASAYDIRVRPWHRRDGNHGTVTVNTTDKTSFEIGEMMYTGTTGLEALAELETGTLTVAFGTLNIEDHSFTAAIVHARDSVSGDGIDAVHGNVVARNGDQLTVKGALVVHRDRDARFHRTVIVEIGPDTKVVKIGDRDTLLNKDDISVGQRIVAFGQLGETDIDPAVADRPDVAFILDATQGRVRMLVTHLRGNINSIVAGQINLDLRAIDRLGIGLFNFSGTGTSPDTDAIPEDYEVATRTLSLNNLVVDKWVGVKGFVSSFGAAPADFHAFTVIDHRDLPAALGMGWGAQGTAAPFLSMGPDGLVLSLDNPEIGARHHLLLGNRLIDLFELPSAPAIVPSQERSLFGIWEEGHIELFTDFPNFVEALTMRLNNADKVRSLAAFGAYDDSTNTVTGRRIAVHMIAAE